MIKIDEKEYNKNIRNLILLPMCQEKYIDIASKHSVNLNDKIVAGAYTLPIDTKDKWNLLIYSKIFILSKEETTIDSSARVIRINSFVKEDIIAVLKEWIV